MKVSIEKIICQIYKRIKKIFSFVKDIFNFIYRKKLHLFRACAAYRLKVSVFSLPTRNQERKGPGFAAAGWSTDREADAWLARHQPPVAAIHQLCQGEMQRQMRPADRHITHDQPLPRGSVS